MSTEPEDDVIDGEIELADAEDYIPSERARRKKKRASLREKKTEARRSEKAEDDAGTVHKGMAQIYRRFTKSGVLSHEEVDDLSDAELKKIGIEPRIFEEPPTRVGVWASATVNMGDFNSVKFGAICVTPCYFEEREDAFNHLKEWITEKVNAEIEEAKEESDAPPKRASSRRRSR